MNRKDITPTERIASISIRLDRGERLTSRAIAEQYGIRTNSAWVLMMRLCRVPELAITFADGEWYSLAAQERTD